MFVTGQKVWDLLHGEGKVISIHQNGDPLVGFNEFTKVRYTPDGKIGKTFNRSLYFSKPEVKGATEPPFVPKLKKGDRILILSNKTNAKEFATVARDELKLVETQSGCIYSKKDYQFYKIGEPIY